MKLSLVVPCFNEESVLTSFYSEANTVVEQLCKDEVIEDYEVLFVDDGSKDTTLSIIHELANKDNHVLYLSFTRNFGKEAAILAGLSYSCGDYVAILDADLQDPPKLLPEMFSILNGKNGFECVATRRTTRSGEPALRSVCARLFYKIINRLSDVEIIDGARDFRLMKRRMVDSILNLKEKNRFSKGLFAWPGYKTYYLEYENIERINGETKWSFWKLLRYSLDGITAFSVAPLQFSAILGLLCCIGSIFMVLFFVLQKMLVGIAIQGYAMLVCAIFLLGGVQLLCLGILGQYLGKLFIEAKQRPDYVILKSNIAAEKRED